MIPFARIIKYGNINPTVIKEIKKIKGTGNGAIYLLSTGDMYSMGGSTYGEITGGAGGPHLMAQNVDDCWGSLWGTLYLQNGRMIYNGVNITIGLGTATAPTAMKNYDCTSLFTDIMQISEIKKIQMGWRTLYVLSNSGMLYGIGLNNAGQLTGAANATIPVSSFRLMSTGVLDFKTNNNNTVYVLKEDGKIYACGQNGTSGYCGIGVTTANVTTLTPISVPVQDVYETLDGVFGCSRVTAVLYSPSTGQLFSTGTCYGAYGGVSAGSANRLAFTAINLPADKTFAGAIYGDSSVSSPFILLSDGWYCTGDNTQGIYGLGNAVYRSAFTKTTIPSDIKVFGYGEYASYYSYGVNENINFYAAGSGSLNTIPGYTTAQYNYIHPVGMTPEDFWP